MTSFLLLFTVIILTKLYFINHRVFCLGFILNFHIKLITIIFTVKSIIIIIFIAAILSTICRKVEYHGLEYNSDYTV